MRFSRALKTKYAATTYLSIGHDVGGVLWWGDEKGVDHRFPKRGDTHSGVEAQSRWYGRFDPKTNRVSVTPGSFTGLYSQPSEAIFDRLKEKFGRDVEIKFFGQDY